MGYGRKRLAVAVPPALLILGSCGEKSGLEGPQEGLEAVTPEALQEHDQEAEAASEPAANSGFAPESLMPEPAAHYFSRGITRGNP